MADFRTIKCSMWREDDWFLDLPTDGKLLWIYLFSNPSASVAGIYRLSLRTIANETGLSQGRIAELMTVFADANKAHFADGVLWVVKMREHQANQSPKVQERIKVDIASIPADNPIYRMYARKYGIGTVSVPIPTATDTATETETVTEPIQQQQFAAAEETPAADKSPVVVALEEIGIFSSSHQAILEANPTLTPEDVYAMGVYAKRTKVRNNGGMGSGAIVIALKAREKAPADCYAAIPDPDSFQPFVLE